jgi:hypothetical protein
MISFDDTSVGRSLISEGPFFMIEHIAEIESAGLSDEIKKTVAREAFIKLGVIHRDIEKNSLILSTSEPNALLY